jgi:hypothetical protein
MNDDLGDRPLDLEQAGNPGQSASSEVVQTEQFVSRRDLQALQSSLESQMAKTRREASEQTRQANLLAAQAQAIIEQAKVNNPDAVPGLIEAARIASERAELAQLKAEREERMQMDQLQQQQIEADLREIEDAKKYWSDRAPKYDVDPKSVEFQNALQQTLRDGDEQHILDIFMAKKLGQSNPQPTTMPVLPPSGGGPQRVLNEQQREEMSGKLIELMREPTKNAPEIAAYKAKLGLI